FIAESDRPAFEAGLREAQQGTAKLEVVLQRGDGRDIPAFLSLKSFRPSESPVVSIVVTDLTEQKRNQEIVAAGKLARTILEQAAEAIAVCDRSGRVLLANQALHE